jgi:hypothetical protein
MRMEKDFKNEEEALQPLLKQIAAEEAPYSDDPGAAYWANFRVRVMERVELEESKRPLALFGKIARWFSVSALRPAMAGIGAVAIAAILIVNTSQQDASKDVAVAPNATQVAPPEQIASNEQSKSEKVGELVVRPQAEPKQTVQEKPVVTPVPDTQYPEPDTRNPEPDDLASAQISMAPAEADAPVTYDDLTASELESVLLAVQGM